ncbi:MAG: DUF2267 domain-containing protein [Alphaproteobacteria bacterium]
MTTLGLRVFDHSIQTTHEWLNDIGEVLGPDAQRAYHAMRAVLHTLRDRLTVNEAADLAAQLPLFVRGVYYEGWQPARTPVKLRSREAFIERVQERLAGGPPMNAEEATKAVFAALKKHCEPGEMADISAQLPRDLSAMFEAA